MAERVLERKPHAREVGRLRCVWSGMQRRGKRRTLIAVAIARSWAGFCWSITQVE